MTKVLSTNAMTQGRHVLTLKMTQQGPFQPQNSLQEEKEKELEFIRPDVRRCGTIEV